MNDFSVKTEVFEGPLDLLLHLIEKRKLLINDISLAQITDDYIAYLKSNNEFSISKNSHFVLVAATLLLIKSKSLLPTLELTDEEEKSIRDLETRLKIYKRIKDEEKTILNLFGKNISFFGGGNYETKNYFLPDKRINQGLIFNAIKSVIKGLPKVEIRPQIILKKVMSLENMIERLTQRISSNLNLSFKEFSGYGKEHKINVVVSFLAVLELVRQGVIDVIQKTDSDDIEIQTKNFNTPNYI